MEARGTETSVVVETKNAVAGLHRRQQAIGVIPERGGLVLARRADDAAIVVVVEEQRRRLVSHLVLDDEQFAGRAVLKSPDAAVGCVLFERFAMRTVDIASVAGRHGYPVFVICEGHRPVGSFGAEETVLLVVGEPDLAGGPLGRVNPAGEIVGEAYRAAPSLGREHAARRVVRPTQLNTLRIGDAHEPTGPVVFPRHAVPIADSHADQPPLGVVAEPLLAAEPVRTCGDSAQKIGGETETEAFVVLHRQRGALTSKRDAAPGRTTNRRGPPLPVALERPRRAERQRELREAEPLVITEGEHPLARPFHRFDEPARSERRRREPALVIDLKSLALRRVEPLERDDGAAGVGVTDELLRLIVVIVQALALRVEPFEHDLTVRAGRVAVERLPAVEADGARRLPKGIVGQVGRSRTIGAPDGEAAAVVTVLREPRPGADEQPILIRVFRRPPRRVGLGDEGVAHPVAERPHRARPPVRPDSHDLPHATACVREANALPARAA